ncbi:hypothetical protein CW712_06590 [Candidatus Bathyarchaeota archaeon]|nr:MAG: hypothetical protein CW712_06590 [Candidatus Bathyarchaeota archaeon]
MTEKIAQLGSVLGSMLLENDKFSQKKARMLLGDGVGEITHISGGTREITDPKTGCDDSERNSKIPIGRNPAWYPRNYS